MSPTDVSEALGRIEHWLARNAPDIADGLQPPASRAALDAAERRLGRPLPAEVRSLYALHDGENGSTPPAFVDWKWLPVQYVVEQYGVLKRAAEENAGLQVEVLTDGKVQSEWWRAGWIPLFGNGSGDYVCVDLEPTREGNVGQLIIYSGRDASRSVAAPSLLAWLSAFAADLEAGRFGRDEHGWLTRVA
jgi:cell wall assembly regulator SMI1